MSKVLGSMTTTVQTLAAERAKLQEQINSNVATLNYQLGPTRDR